ncbi:Thiol:disulfide interchange protein DsbA precursor [Kingella potus]|uniref:Thiol:disulfide interchange protein n=1 Tax=Kingella potus TaxID=265175 RepID=A0A377QYZ9_9NEIS|nr:thiol:disulfide interchange protein DsbA/DsbL [Kingella potus]UOP01445.1 thiol:disulfide interchange protein DsbA/DsbL [Kingella potus]STR00237.1 Thiol:disulfide interchange protein DsbA precursor [Kingella potus]
MKLKHTLLAAALTFGFASAQAALVEGEDYTVLDKPLAPLQNDKIEVAEFFGYFCIHCFHLEPEMEKHSKKWASDTYLRPIHVVWQPEHMQLARIAAAVGSSNMRHQANMPVFRAIFEQNINLADPAAFKQWAGSQSGFDGKKLLAAYESFGNEAQAKQMADLTEQMKIENTPTVIVGGKYRMKFTSRDWNVSMNKVDEMIAKVRQERGMKEPAPRAAVRSKGVAAARAANK